MSKKFNLPLTNWQRKAVRSWMRLMLNPIVIFVSLQIVWVAVLVLWVIWFIDQQDIVKQFTKATNIITVDSGYSLGFLIAGCILLGFIFFGTVFLFIFAQKQSVIVSQQRNFVASVTHELRSPLASLQLGFETLESRTLDPSTARKIYDMVGKDIARLQKLIDQILVSGRLDRGILVSEKYEVIDIQSLIEEVIRASKYMDNDLENRIHVECSKGLKFFSIRPVLNLVMSNLIENAIKYSPKNSLIGVYVKVVDKMLCIEVTDQGFGIAKRDQKRVFKMFHRAKLASSKAIPGTGLGLYIVRNVVRHLGGRVWVESSGLNQGSIFKVRIPEVQSLSSLGK